METTCDSTELASNTAHSRAARWSNVSRGSWLSFRTTEYGRSRPSTSVPRSGSDEFTLDAEELLQAVEKAIDDGDGMNTVVDHIADLKIDSRGVGSVASRTWMTDGGIALTAITIPTIPGNSRIRRVLRDPEMMRDRLLHFLRERHPQLLEVLAWRADQTCRRGVEPEEGGGRIVVPAHRLRDQVRQGQAGLHRAEVLGPDVAPGAVVLPVDEARRWRATAEVRLYVNVRLGRWGAWVPPQEISDDSMSRGRS